MSATCTSDSSAFTFDDKEIGNIGTAAAYDNDKITLNGYIYNANAGGLGVAGSTADGGVASGNYYKYSGNIVKIA